MAITNNGTRVRIDASLLPTGYTKPVVTTFTDYEYTRDLTLTVLKSTVENATASTTMANILSNATVGINKQITDILTAEFISTATVTAFADLLSLSNNYVDLKGTGAYLTNTAPSYVAVIKLYVKSI